MNKPLVQKASPDASPLASVSGPLLRFIIPIRHPRNAKDWAGGMRRLRQTAASIANQSSPDWDAVVIANHEAELPELPDRFRIERVGFPPNAMHDRGQAPDEDIYDAFRLDKGRRVHAALVSRSPALFTMIVDDDDFVSRLLTTHVASHPNANGWTVRRGYVWGEGGSLLFAHGDFASLCGTSHIVRTELYGAAAESSATPAQIKRMLGSHRFIEADLASIGRPLADLPFPGALYRIGHENAHSGSSGILKSLVLNRDLIRRPHRIAGRIARLRWLDTKLRREFFGSSGGED